MGFIAEDVPDLVATPNRKSLSPMDIVAVLTKVVQEQQNEACWTCKNIVTYRDNMDSMTSGCHPLVSLVKIKLSIPAERAYGSYQLILDLSTIDHGLNDHGAVSRYQLSYKLKPAKSCKTDRDVLAIGVNLADVDLPKPCPESLQQTDGDPHGRIYLSGMTDIEAKARIRKLRKDRLHLRHGPPGWLSLIHIL